MTTNNPTRFDEYSPQMGFCNELVAYAWEVASVQAKTTDFAAAYGGYVWKDAEIQMAAQATDPRHVNYDEAGAEAIFTRAMDRLSQMMRQAVRAKLAEDGKATAIDSREWNKPAERARRAAARR